MAGRGDVLELMLQAGRMLGVAEARRALSGAGHPDFRGAIAETLAIAADVEHGADPVAGRVIREAALRVLHGETAIEGTAHDVEPPALGPGS